MWEHGVEFVFLERLFEPSKLDRNIVKTAGPEAPIEMPQSRNDDPHDRRLDIGPRLIENEEIEALPLGDRDAGGDLLIRIQAAELGIELGFQHFAFARQQEGMIRQPQWRHTIEAPLQSGSVRHEFDGHKLIQFCQRSQHGDARIEMRAGAEFNIFVPVLLPMRYRDKARNAKIAGYVKHPETLAAFGQLNLQIPDVGIVEPVKIDCRPFQAVIPPDRVGIPLNQFEEALNDRFLARIACGAAVRNPHEKE